MTKTTKDLIENNTGYGFFGTASEKLGYRQAGEAYRMAATILAEQGHGAEAEQILDSRIGRHWADCLDWNIDYGVTLGCRSEVVMGYVKGGVAKSVKKGYHKD